MNNRIYQLAEQAKANVPNSLVVTEWIECYNKELAQLIIDECVHQCGSQADMRNIRKHFGLEVESNIKYPAVDPYWSVTSQYERKYNIPEK